MLSTFQSEGGYLEYLEEPPPWGADLWEVLLKVKLSTLNTRQVSETKYREGKSITDHHSKHLSADHCRGTAGIEACRQHPHQPVWHDSCVVTGQPLHPDWAPKS